MALKIRYDLKKDAWNHWSCVNERKSYSNPLKYMNSAWIRQIKGKSQKEVKRIMKKRASRSEKSPLLKIYIDSIGKAWKSVEKEYFKRLEMITKKPMCSKKFTAYVTTVPRCPYDFKNKWFMINFFAPIPHTLRTIGHELMHFQFHEYFWKGIEKELGERKTGDLKEALTVLLNLEFRDLWMAEDLGYEPHKELRAFIEKEWRKKKDFGRLLERCVEFLK